MPGKPLVLILCTGNSCRSQMAEAVLKAEAEDLVEAASAGSKPAGFVHPLALQVIAEAGLSLPGARSNPLDEFLVRDVHTVITVCGRAEAACPAFPGKCLRHHWPFDDPAAFKGGEEETLAEFRRVFTHIQRVFRAYAAGWRDASR
ncbi:MAG: arsenate reductase ArsC [Terrimicrobiaceae bacterium]|nr:arsenate reductase ArsC [Terrimicrobiaceae bacterium]